MQVDSESRRRTIAAMRAPGSERQLRESRRQSDFVGAWRDAPRAVSFE